MEIKAKLNKPYSDNERIDFVVEQNHKNGYEIKETETALEAWGYTEEEKKAKSKESRKKELIAELDALDLKQIRSLAAKVAGTATDEDLAILADLEEQKAVKRQELKNLQGE